MSEFFIAICVNRNSVLHDYCNIVMNYRLANGKQFNKGAVINKLEGV